MWGDIAIAFFTIIYNIFCYGTIYNKISKKKLEP